MMILFEERKGRKVVFKEPIFSFLKFVWKPVNTGFLMFFMVDVKKCFSACKKIWK